MTLAVLRVAALAGLCACGGYQSVRFVGTADVGPRSGPYASSDQMLMMLGHPAPTAALLELIESVPRDRAVTMVGFEPHLMPIGLTIANLAFPRPTYLWECDSATGQVRQRLPHPPLQSGPPLAFVYSGTRIDPRPGYISFGDRLIALRRMRGVPRPGQLCAPDLAPDPGETVSRGRAALLVSRLLHRDGSAPPTPQGLFDDVDRRSRQAAAIEELHERGLIAGCARRRFCPEEPITRGALAVLAMGATDTPQEASHGMFADAPKDRPDSAAIERAHALGVGACAQVPPRFCPDLPVTREAADALLAAAVAVRRP
jgi:hypothetical protein